MSIKLIVSISMALGYFLAVLLLQGGYNYKKDKLGNGFIPNKMRTLHYWLGVGQLLLLMSGIYYSLNLWINGGFKNAIANVGVYPVFWCVAMMYANGGLFKTVQGIRNATIYLFMNIDKFEKIYQVGKDTASRTEEKNTSEPSSNEDNNSEV